MDIKVCPTGEYNLFLVLADDRTDHGRLRKALEELAQSGQLEAIAWDHDAVIAFTGGKVGQELLQRHSLAPNLIYSALETLIVNQIATGCES